MESDSNNHKMKTAEEWYKVLTTTEVIDKQTGGDLLITHINKEQVRQIQLDAWKQGMTDAAKIPYRGDITGPLDCQEAILKERDNKTSI